MLSSKDEACKLEFRSEKIPYHSVHSNSFLFNNFARRRAGKVLPLGRLHTTRFFSRRKKTLGMLMWRVIFAMFDHVW